MAGETERHRILTWVHVALLFFLLNHTERWDINFPRTGHPAVPHYKIQIFVFVREPGSLVFAKLASPPLDPPSLALIRRVFLHDVVKLLTL